MSEADFFGAAFAWANFHNAVIYGFANWPTYSYWIVPGTITHPVAIFASGAAIGVTRNLLADEQGK